MFVIVQSWKIVRIERVKGMDGWMGGSSSAAHVLAAFAGTRSSLHVAGVA
jgi:hypothetical protein